MASLRRAETGGFTLDDAHTIEEIAEDPEKYLLSTESLFSELKALDFHGNGEKMIKNGVAVKVDGFSDGERARLYANGEFFGLGEVKGSRVKCIKFFSLD